MKNNKPKIPMMVNLFIQYRCAPAPLYPLPDPSEKK
jgi:hypothetical protein